MEQQYHAGWLLVLLVCGLYSAVWEGYAQQDALRTLASGRFVERERAMQELAKAGVEIIPALADAAVKPDPDLRYRAFLLLDGYFESGSPEEMAASEKVLKLLSRHADAEVAERARRSLRFVDRSLIDRLQQAGASIIRSPAGDIIKIRLRRRNNLETADLQFIGRLSKLEELWLDFTKLDDAFLEHIADLQTLRVLSVKGSKVTDAGMAHLTKLVNVETLSVERTAVTDAGLEFVQPMKKLSKCYFGGSKIKGPGLSYLKHLDKLVYVSFEYSDVIDDQSVAYILSGLPQVVTLGLDRTSVTGRNVAKLKQLEHLDELWLSHSPVTDEVLSSLRHFGHLSKLQLKGLPLKTAQIEQLRRQLPQTTIVR